jgi:hypothetical protein
MNIKTFKEALPFLFQANVATLVIGHHGVGKSQGVKQYTEENPYVHPKKGKIPLGFVDLRLGTQDVGDLLGLADFVVDERGEKVATKFMRPEWFPNDPDSQGIIFLDEINRGRRDVLQAVFQLVLDKKLHRYTLPKGWHVVAAMNPSTDDYIVTDISDKAFLDRFCHIKLAPSKQEFFDYAKSRKFETELTQFLQDQPGLLQTDLEEFSLDVKPSRRSWEAVDRLLKAKTPVNLLRELSNGLVGPAAGSAFIKSLSETDKPISGKEILENWTKHTKKIKEYSNAKTGGRQDMLKFTCDSLLEGLSGRKEQFTKDEAKNLEAFLIEIPKDLSFDLCRQLYMEAICRPVIDNSQKLLELLANARKIKVEGVNC